jgi:hypothetical protein
LKFEQKEVHVGATQNCQKNHGIIGEAFVLMQLK